MKILFGIGATLLIGSLALGVGWQGIQSLLDDDYPEAIMSITFALAVVCMITAAWFICGG